MYATTRDWNNAIAALVEASRLEPHNERVWSRLAQTYQRAERWREAVQAYHRLYQLSPGEAYVSYNLGECYDADQNPRSAIEWFERALQVNPVYADAFVGLFKVHARNRHWDTALSVGKRFAGNSLDQFCR